MSEQRNRESPDNSQPGEAEMSEAEIDSNLMGSFPASDPPSWTNGTDHRHEQPSAPVDERERNK